MFGGHKSAPMRGPPLLFLMRPLPGGGGGGARAALAARSARIRL